MREYFDFVLVKHENDRVYLFRAPAFTHLEFGDEVVVETSNGEQRGIVQSSITLAETDTDQIDFIMRSTGAPDEVKKVLSKVIYQEFKYGEDEQ